MMANPPSVPLLHGRYRIEEQLGTGRLAAVYRAYDERLQRKVLVHLLRKDLMGQDALRERFIQEAHISARRSHQSLLEVFDSGDVAGRPYMITEYVAGRTLREIGAMSLEEALLYFRQLVGAVATCQAAGVPHPPISSNNVVLVADGHVELLENWQTPAAELARDAASYRAPERSAGAPAGSASTVYALGLLLIEMLAGKRVIQGDDPRAIAQQHLTAQIPALSEIRPLLYAPSLDQILRRATARRPEDRYSDADTLGQALDDLRRDASLDTQRLAAPPVQPVRMRDRISRSTGPLRAPKAVAPPPPAPAADDDQDEYAPPIQRRPSAARRSLFGMAIMLTMLVVFACGAYYGISVAIDRIANIQLPRPALPSLPDLGVQLPDLGIDLPNWLTGIVSGGGQVWIVNIDGPEGLNLRREPGTNAEIITFLPSGTHVRQIGGPRTVDNVEWLQVRAQNGNGDVVEGWVSKLFLRPE